MLEITRDSAEADRDQPQVSSNRYILIAALAFAAVLAVYIVKTNLEPPKPQDVAATQEANSRILDGEQQVDDVDAAAVHEELISQVGHIKTILTKDSTNFDAWAALGNLYFDANMPEDAISHYRRALALKPDDIHILTDMATMLRASGRADTAVTVLNHVIWLDSTLAQAWFNLGVIQSFDLKNQKEALHAWKKFIALSPPSEHTDAVNKEIERLEKEIGS